MARYRYGKEIHRWLATAYHEAGHAVAILLMGGTLLLVEVTSPASGRASRVNEWYRLMPLIDIANSRRRMPSELLRLWRDEFWISDAGHVAEAEFNLVSEAELSNGSLGDRMSQIALLGMMEEGSFAEVYFSRHFHPWSHLLTEDCRAFFRIPRIAAMTRTLAEALFRTPHMTGWEVIDTLLANHAVLTGQFDFFWAPPGDETLVRRKPTPPAKQLRLW